MKEVVTRLNKRTPKFFKKLQRIGILTGTIAAGILTAGTALPFAVLTAAGYLAAVSGTVVAVSQLTTKEAEDEENEVF